jgi:hypothetical protein
LKTRSPLQKAQFQLGQRRYGYPLTITDRHSRFLLGCEGLEAAPHVHGRELRPVRLFSVCPIACSFSA